ncbi:MAG: hypothetical protein ACLSGB_02105 [Dorea sp.]
MYCGGRLAAVVCGLLKNKSSDYGGEIEDLFQAEMYLISPLTEPLKFLRRIFPDSPSKGTWRQILKRIRTEHTGYYSFSGLPGVGKTLLLYDIAMKLSQKHKVCMIHCGEAGKNGRFCMNDYDGSTFGRIIR